MKKTDLIEKIAATTNLSKKEVGTVLEAYFETVGDALKAGDSVQVIGFGNFAVREIAAHTGRNPLTKQTITIPASRRVSFSAGKALKDKVN